MIVSFVDYVPPARFDGDPWTQIRISEASTSAGPWTLIETIPISPVDTDPVHPQPRSFTTENATLEFGWYKVSFFDATNNYVDGTPRQNLEAVPFIPTVKQVATHILSRTVDQYGRRQGTFTNETTPTAEEVEQIIGVTMPEVIDVIGEDLPEFLWDDAAAVSSLRVAMQTELSFFSEQVNTGRSIYPQLKEKYDEAVANLTKQVTAAAEGGTGAVVSGVANSPSWGFPASEGWLVRIW